MSSAQSSVATFSHLNLRFAASTAVVIAIVGAALLWYVQRTEVNRAERNVTQHARYVELSVLRQELTAAGPVGGRSRLAQADPGCALS